MAFHQPTTRHALQRVVRAAPEDAAAAAVIETSSPLEESQTWVLFSPATDTATTTSYISSVHDSQQTAGRSRISDLGSLNTLPRSDVHSHAGELAAGPMEEDAGDEDAELDSLDSHLPDFRSVPHSQHHQVHASATVLPRHDGLGSFRLDTAGIATDMQEHMYAFERYNPQRKSGHDAGINLAELEMDQDRIQQMERIQRIEAWRLEQSKLLLDEIQKETRRRRQQTAGSVRESRSDSTVTEAVMTPAPTDDTMQGTEWHDQDTPHDLGVEEGLWSRITRKLIRDIMGIDDRMLGILFGEELVVEDDLSSTPKASELSAGNNSSHSDPIWQLRMLERASQELGMLVHQMSAHPGAFSTYMRVQQMPLPYAGLPVIPETTVEADEPAARNMGESAATTASPQFHPTIGKAAQAMNIPGRREAASAATSAHVPGNFTQHEWEQELDIKLVFRYLRSRFLSRTSSSSSASPLGTGGTAHLATSSTQEAAAKAARVRQHHPLVGRSLRGQGSGADGAGGRRQYRVGPAPGSPVAAMHHHHLHYHHHHHRHASSCASQSTRRSAATRRSSLSGSRHSSHHYWDIGGSIGTGSMIVSSGPMGSWGEV